MRKVICFFLAFVMLVSLSAGAFAAETEDGISKKVRTCQLEAEDISRSASQVIPVTNGKNFRGGVLREFTFDKCEVDSALSDRQEKVLAEKGNVAVYVEIASWSPAEGDLALGLYNTETGELRYRTLSGGEVKDSIVEFKNLDAGTYWLVVKNLAEDSLTAGTVRYSFG